MQNVGVAWVRFIMSAYKIIELDKKQSKQKYAIKKNMYAVDVFF